MKSSHSAYTMLELHFKYFRKKKTLFGLGFRVFCAIELVELF